MAPAIHIKRAYEEPLKKDGYRILVDRLWPRGIKKEEAVLNEWTKDLAPSAELRKWFGHDPARWPEFQRKYKGELNQNKAVADFVKQHADKRVITLIYAAKDAEHNHAIVLQEYLKRKYQ